jgi:superfamily I DNA/RNA helicase
MAILIPSLGFARFDSRDELRLAERLKDFLEENAVVWHNLPVGPLNRHPDFIIVHPASSLLVLEVKDWRLETIVSADKTKVELLTDRGVVRESNPLEQARRYTFEVERTLERDERLPIDIAKDNRNRISVKRVAVRFLSMHSAKCLEFPCVAIAGLGALGRHGETVEECVRLTYVGVTRATHEALLTYSNESALVQRLIA